MVDSWSISARRPFEVGGGSCTLVVIPHEGRIRVCHHGTLSAAAELDVAEVDQLVAALTGAKAAIARSASSSQRDE